MSTIARSWIARPEPAADAPAPSLPAGSKTGAVPALRVMMHEVLKLLPGSAALLDREGNLLLANEPFQRLARCRGYGERLEQEIALQLRAALAANPYGCAADATPVPLRSTPGRAPLSLQARWIDLEAFGLGRVVIAVVRAGEGAGPGDELLRERFRLTRKEILVARLLAEGRSNTGVAAALCISPHTARHHTERVLTKLSVRSRAEVGARLRGLASDE